MNFEAVNDYKIDFHLSISNHFWSMTHDKIAECIDLKTRLITFKFSFCSCTCLVVFFLIMKINVYDLELFERVNLFWLILFSFNKYLRRLMWWLEREIQIECSIIIILLFTIPELKENLPISSSSFFVWLRYCNRRNLFEWTYKELTYVFRLKLIRHIICK